ncbi:MAG: SUF system NifU family Fe-S cluster assembly protein [Acidocella sp. 20-57-95]|nr:MAG: SUF system NifU family Fe-S cluster assembly protein [Acidocella sp. 20-57-95]OYV59029.1 MAG: SUF system NifU family Fe-S cluster assembly protein [Acidocella sp. 21-58-7]HQT65592.1 SUF system NifU family Fe-S cluster assembly protein [Acidocella sp.]HQU04912.1 SUF system NifU family Fe-S cluster assembly protein [Acidocella sp.]
MSETADLYQAIIMDRTKNPRHAGKPPHFNREGHGDNPMCGDRIHVYVADDGTQVHHESRGCAIMIASAELMADAVAGLTADAIAERRKAFEAMVTTGTTNPTLGDLNALSGVSEYRSRIRCATLPWSALTAALEGAK